MRADNAKRSYKIWYSVSTTVILILMVVYVVSLISLKTLSLYTIVFFSYFLFMCLILVPATIHSLEYHIIDETGITRCFLFSKKHYGWDDLQFIAKARHYIKLSGSTGEKIVVSVTIPKENFKRKHAFCLCSKKSFYMPYSKAVEDYIIAKSPVDCYTHSYIVDDTTDEKLKKWY